MRGREREREGEKHQCVVASHMPLTGDLARNPGMCPDLGIQPATLPQARAPSTELHQPGLDLKNTFTRIPEIKLKIVSSA